MHASSNCISVSGLGGGDRVRASLGVESSQKKSLSFDVQDDNFLFLGIFSSIYKNYLKKIISVICTLSKIFNIRCQYII